MMPLFRDNNSIQREMERRHRTFQIKKILFFIIAVIIIAVNIRHPTGISIIDRILGNDDSELTN